MDETNDAYSDLILQMDIEGGEYDCLSFLLLYKDLELLLSNSIF